MKYTKYLIAVVTVVSLSGVAVPISVEAGNTMSFKKKQCSSKNKQNAVNSFRAVLRAEVKNSMTALHSAAFKGLIGEIKLCIDHKTDLNVKDIYSSTPLHYAVSGRRGDVVKLLLINGADVNSKDMYGIAPLDAALKQNRKDVVELFKRAAAAKEAGDKAYWKLKMNLMADLNKENNNNE